SRVTLLGNEAMPSVNMVDLVEPRSNRYAKSALDQAIAASLRGVAVRVLAPEDFVLFKALSTRERDIEDAAAVVRALGSGLNLGAIESEAKQLATEIQGHDVVGRLRRVLTSS